VELLQELVIQTLEMALAADIMAELLVILHLVAQEL
jgi:hypothetical protein